MSGITTTNLGKVQPISRGEYNSATTYTKLDIVTFNGSSYILKVNTATGIVPTTSTYWQLVAGKGDPGAQGNRGPSGKIVGVSGTIEMSPVDTQPDIDVENIGTDTEANLKFNFKIPFSSEPVFRGTYNNATTYNKFDNVLYSGSTYLSLTDNNIGNTPYNGSIFWQLLAEKGTKGDQGNVTSLGQIVATAEASSEADVSVEQSGDFGENLTFHFDLPAGPRGFDTVSASAESGSSTSQPQVEATIQTVGGNRNLDFAFTIPAAEGTGVNSVDGVGPSAGGNIDLKTIRYSQQTLSAGNKKIARENINAMEEPENKEYGSFLCYGGDVANPQWISQSILQVPIGGTAGYILRKQESGYGWTPAFEIPQGGAAGNVLVKNSNASYDVTWTGIITNSDIDNIMT